MQKWILFLALPMTLISFSAGLSRPPSNHLVLKEIQRGTGSASSLFMFTVMTAGAFAMWFVFLN